MHFVKATRACVSAGMVFVGLSLAGIAGASTRTVKPNAPKHTHGSVRSRKASPRRSSKASSRHVSYNRNGRRARRSTHHHAGITGQRVMDMQRATEIQQALIQAHYLSGSPTGQWDAESQAAMMKYQSDNGWQTKITPDSRALIKLGLGPKQDAGEYANTPAGISANTASPESIHTVANSAPPSTAANQN
ncbi:MAG TPA: peptidoglycan-binding domain-containing protein [Acidobacteriaceae bacterium]|nr:peptidoglycan-binding domain-containing protein [Acidobacteriaceae bacterium]